MPRLVSVLLVLSVAITGCVLGSRVATFPPAQTPGGVDVTLRFGSSQLAGELLAVEDTSLLIAVRWPNPDSSNTPRLARVATRGIRAVAGPVSTRQGWAKSDPVRFRNVARYPQGVSTALEARLVAAYAVDSVRWVRP